MTDDQIVLLTSEQSFQATVADFIIDRQSRGLSANTIRFYRDELGLLLRWLQDHSIQATNDITADVLRSYFTDLRERRNKGGTHASFRAIKACLRWLEDEEDGDYKNPIHKVKVSPQKPRSLPGIPVSDIQRMIDACKTDMGQRDQTILRLLLDTGARAFEFVALDLGDIDLSTGAIKILRGKGDKERAVYIGPRSRKSLRRYLKSRTHLNPSAPLWLTDEGDRLTKRGLRAVVERRAHDAGVAVPGLHDFRRAFALNMWRAGVDLLTISRLMGHSSLTVTQRYIACFEGDLQKNHAKGSPVDNANL